MASAYSDIVSVIALDNGDIVRTYTDGSISVNGIKQEPEDTDNTTVDTEQGSPTDDYSAPTNETMGQWGNFVSGLKGRLEGRMAGKAPQKIQAIIQFIMGLFGSMSGNWNIAGIQGILGRLGSSLLNQLKGMGLEYWDKLNAAAIDFLNSAFDEIMDIIISRMNIPDFIFAGMVESAYRLGGDINYNEEFLRRRCTVRDWPHTYRLCLNIRRELISYYNNKVAGDFTTACNSGCFQVAEVILEGFQVDIARLEADLRLARAEGNEERIRRISQSLTTLNNFIHSGINSLIVNSYGNFKGKDMMRMVTSFNLKPKALGVDVTNEFPASTMITEKQLDSFVPLYSDTSQRLGNTHGSLLNGENGINQQVSGGANVIGNIANAWTGDRGRSPDIVMQDPAGNRHPVKPPIEFINPRNINIKAIYTVLVNKSINRENIMINEPFYRRLKYPILNKWGIMLDRSFANLNQSQIHKINTTVLDTILASIYTMTNELDLFLFDPAKFRDLGLNPISDVNVHMPKNPNVFGSSYANLSGLDPNFRSMLLDIIDRLNLDSVRGFILRIRDLYALTRAEIAPRRNEALDTYMRYLFNREFDNLFSSMENNGYLNSFQRFELNAVLFSYFGIQLTGQESSINLRRTNANEMVMIRIFFDTPNPQFWIDVFVAAVNDSVSNSSNTNRRAIYISIYRFLRNINGFLTGDLQVELEEFVAQYYGDNWLANNYNVLDYADNEIDSDLIHIALHDIYEEFINHYFKDYYENSGNLILIQLEIEKMIKEVLPLFVSKLTYEDLSNNGSDWTTGGNNGSGNNSTNISGSNFGEVWFSNPELGGSGLGGNNNDSDSPGSGFYIRTTDENGNPISEDLLNRRIAAGTQYARDLLETLDPMHPLVVRIDQDRNMGIYGELTGKTVLPGKFTHTPKPYEGIWEGEDLSRPF